MKEKNMYKHIATLTTLGLSLLLAACGGNSGGGAGIDAGSTGGPANVALAEGAWTGTNSVGNSFDMLVLEDGTLYSMQGTITSGNLLAAGFDIGTATVNGSTMTANLTHYDYRGNRVTGPLMATVVSGKSINGTAGLGNGQVTFNSSPLSASYSSYNYNTPAAISDVAGAWTGNVMDVSDAASAFSIAADGALANTDLGCSYTGKLTPRSSGKNVFNVRIQYGPSPCAAANEAASGVAISYVLSNGKRQLVMAVENTARSKGGMLTGQR